MYYKGALGHLTSNLVIVFNKSKQVLWIKKKYTAIIDLSREDFISQRSSELAKTVLVPYFPENKLHRVKIVVLREKSRIGI